MSTSNDPAFERMLVFLRDTRGFDFTSYRRSSVMRRVIKRMETVGARGFDDYLDYLKLHTDEFHALFNTVLIKVSRFFRDAPVWETLSTSVLPALAGRAADAPLRIWSAGAAAGQEAYSVAMVAAELLGPVAYRERVKIYATDVDDDALTEARHAVYPADQLVEVPEALRGRYFEQAGGRYTVKRELRRGVLFGHHDLLQDAPIPRIDLLLCRNTLMYFNAGAQADIMARLAVSMGAGGFVVLGRAEMLFSHAGLFEPADLNHRIFRTRTAAVQPRTSTVEQLETTNEELQSTNEGSKR